MPSEMRRPEMPDLDHFINALDRRLRTEVVAARRAVPPRGLYALLNTLRKLAKPLAQSGAMALTGLAVIVAIGATPAARTSDLVHPISAPLASPNDQALIESDMAFVYYLPEDDILAVQEADNPDTPTLVTE